LSVAQDSPTILDRALDNLWSAWRDIAQAARLSDEDEGAGSLDRKSVEMLKAQIQECLDARGGEVSARARAARIGQTYLRLDETAKQQFLRILADDLGVDGAGLQRAIETFEGADDPASRLAAQQGLRDALQTPRERLLTRFNGLPDGVKFVVDMRARVLSLSDGDPAMEALARDMQGLLAGWFDVGFLDLKPITWESPAALLEKLIAYESVHEIRSWDDLRNRLEADRRCYGFFHPRMPGEPLIFIEVALVKGLARSVQALLDETAPEQDPRTADTAIFYSISNTQDGLRGISFGNFLIKRVVDSLAAELPQLKTFATLSPLPGFRAWLERRLAEPDEELLSKDERSAIEALAAGSDGVGKSLAVVLARPGWSTDEAAAEALRRPLLRLAAQYLVTQGENGRVVDRVGHFHLNNGARIERINWLGDTSGKGLRQAAGLMVNYLYERADIEANHEAYARDGAIAVSSEVRSLAAGRPGNGRNGSAKLRVRARSSLRKMVGSA
jgi:malonyl-CoA decarboxylase